LIAWETARRIAVTVAARTERAPEVGNFDYPAAVEYVSEPLSEFTGVELPGGSRDLRVADRSDWIDFNVEGFGELLEPLLKRAAEESGEVSRALSAATLTTQIGLLLGFLSSRVLGQYDTGPLPMSGKVQGSSGSGTVFFLDGNIVSVARRLGVPVDGLRLWIVTHEMTHAFQFEGYPWLREHLGELLREFMAPLAERFGPRELAGRVARNLRNGGRSFELLMDARQRRAFERMQASMAVIEGYSDYIMHHVGRNLVPDYEHISQRMSRHRLHRPPLESAVFRLTGLDAKLQQYVLGERFANAVASRKGIGFLNQVWERPANLPSLEEVRDPGLWMERMEAA
jgi:coenzyme F420 biosynthesis associated uncharacterized protein